MWIARPTRIRLFATVFIAQGCWVWAGGCSNQSAVATGDPGVTDGAGDVGLSADSVTEVDEGSDAKVADADGSDIAQGAETSDADGDVGPAADATAETADAIEEIAQPQCVGGCDDANTCTNDICSGDGSCQHIPWQVGKSCGGDNVCNNTGVCANPTVAMVLIPGGTFWMGCNAAKDAFCGVFEVPQHKVTLSPFYIDPTETTVAQYALCVNAGACPAPSSDIDTAWGVVGKEDMPVNNVDWATAQQFCQWRGAGFDLPTEAQWEFAARGSCELNGSTGADPACKNAMRTYPWGDAPPGCGKVIQPDCEAEFSLPVGSKPAGDSPYGIHDMAGGVAEWTRDLFDAYTPDDQIDPLGPTSGAKRIVRDAQWVEVDFTVTEFRSSNRRTQSPGVAAYNLGLRCVRVAP